jgi:ribonuclease BN (tRNA processing enzyme)
MNCPAMPPYPFAFQRLPFTIGFMKLTILGSGTVVPDGERNSSGYFVEAGKARVMMDCGAGTVHALARYGLDWEAMSHLFISHFHVDHIGELASLFFAFRHGMKSSRREPLTLVAPHGIERLIHHLKAAFGERLFTPSFPLRIHEMAPGESFVLDEDCILTVAKTPHTDESLAVRIQQGGRSISYTGDTDYCESLERFFQGTSLLVAECSFPEPKAEVRHLAIDEVARLANRAKAESLLVSHFYFPVDEERLKKQLRATYAGNIWIGKDGMSLNIG